MDETATATVPLAGEVLAAYDRFVAQGGDTATFFKANPEVIPPAPPQPRPAEADIWQQIRQDISAAAAAQARASFAWKQRRAQRGRQTR